MSKYIVKIVNNYKYLVLVSCILLNHYSVYFLEWNQYDCVRWS